MRGAQGSPESGERRASGARLRACMGEGAGQAPRARPAAPYLHDARHALVRGGGEEEALVAVEDEVELLMGRREWGEGEDDR